MIFLKIFIIFTKIGTFNFGGGYAMLSLIHNEVVVKNQWMTNAEFTDIVAISQSTPGPIGINAATYAGYTSVLHAGYPEWAAVLGSVLAWRSSTCHRRTYCRRCRAAHDERQLRKHERRSSHLLYQCGDICGVLCVDSSQNC